MVVEMRDEEKLERGHDADSLNASKRNLPQRHIFHLDLQLFTVSDYIAGRR